MFQLLLTVHILAVAAWLGGNLIGFLAESRLASADAATRRWWLSMREFAGKTYFNAAGVIVLLSGVALVLNENSAAEFSDMYVSLGFLAVIVGMVLGMAVFGPGARKAVAAIDAGDAPAEKALVSRLAAFRGIETIVVIVALVAMVAKW